MLAVSFNDCECTFCGRPSIEAICDECYSERWTQPDEPRCESCGGAIENESLRRLGSLRCQDCRQPGLLAA